MQTSFRAFLDSYSYSSTKKQYSIRITVDSECPDVEEMSKSLPMLAGKHIQTALVEIPDAQ